MAKITAVIDIGSNSARMIVCQKSSRFAFHIIYEAKSRVRISEGSYENGGILQEKPIQRATEALKDFVKIAKSLKARKILCVATSAVRDAKNRTIFLNKIKRETGLSIKVIDGKKEAYYGAMAASNLLPKYDCVTTIDIGGGSTELAKIKNGRIVDTISLDMGTIRLKELFYDKEKNFNELEKFINLKLQNVPEHFRSKNIIAIGGTARAISKLVMPKHYPIETLHAYEYNFLDFKDFLYKISQISISKLKKYNIKKHRVDTFREGVTIFVKTLSFLNTKHITTSGVGVREGIYLHDLLRTSNYKFPANFNPSLKSLSDRFLINETYSNCTVKNVLKIFDTLKPLHKLDDTYKKELIVASKLLSIGSSINYYGHHRHSFCLIMSGLNYGYTHKEKLLIAFITMYQNKKLPKEEEIKSYIKLLPKLDIIKNLSFIISISKCLQKNLEKSMYDFKLENKTLFIISKNEKCYLCDDCIKEILKPFSINIVIEYK